MKEIPTGRRFLGALLILVIVGAAALVVWVRRVPKSGADRGPLRVYGSIPDFSLVERSGRAVTRAELLGKVWIADFIFTHCAGPCPLMTLQMAKLQTDLARKGDVRLVSITVDPERDSPEVLSQYADHYKASKDRWLFLTGEKNAIYRLATESFYLPVKENSPTETVSEEGSVIHSTRFVLIDRQGRIRGYYDGTDAEVLQRLLPDVGTLLREESAGASPL
jgi:cytochrome oxidase Cu insertion factor (SCO1/SenC/PrrC family)